MSGSPTRSPTSEPPPSARAGVFSDIGAYAAEVSIAPSTSSSPMRSRAAISATVGERYSSLVRSLDVRLTSRLNSCIRRGTWTPQVRSRKWRRSSPMIVTAAKPVNAPRSGS